MKKKTLTKDQQNELLSILQTRFEKNMTRHIGIQWVEVMAKLVEPLIG